MLSVLAIGLASATWTGAYTLIVPVPVTAPPKSISMDCEFVTVTVALLFVDVKSIYSPTATAAEFCVNPTFATAIKSRFCVSVSVPE